MASQTESHHHHGAPSNSHINEDHKQKNNLEQLTNCNFCSDHEKTILNMVCLDAQCRNRGLICQNCLTIKGRHKGHDSMNLIDFINNMYMVFKSSPLRETANGILQEINELYQCNISRLHQFEVIVQNLIRNFVAKKQQLHTEKINYTNTETLIQRCRQADFQSARDFGMAITQLTNRLQYKDSAITSIDPDDAREESNFAALQYYLTDLNHEHERINDELKKIVLFLENFLSVRNWTPTVLPSLRLFDTTMNIASEAVHGMYDSSDYTFIGELKDGLPCGQGVAFFRNSGKIYEGDWVDGKLEGRGFLFFRTGDIYDGEFRDDRKEGQGIYTWRDGQQQIHRYEGEFGSSQRNGRGVFIWGDGSRYQGEFKLGVQCGWGILYRADGSKQYEGQWESGCFQGEGKQYLENNEMYQGQFKKDKFDGQGVFHQSDGTSIHGIWQNSELVVVNMTTSVFQQ